jgi:hypothetical protein
VKAAGSEKMPCLLEQPIEKSSLSEAAQQENFPKSNRFDSNHEIWKENGHCKT